MELPQPRRLNLDEFLEIDAGSDERLEYRGGFIVAQATPSKNHARIAGNLAMHLGPLARVSGCDFFAGDAKVVTPDGSRVIPDFVVTCDPRDRDAADERGEAIVRHPWLVVEILSPATAADDTTQKLDLYESIPGLTHFVVIDSRRRAIRLYERSDAGGFLTHHSLESLFLPAPLDRALSLDAIYGDTTVPVGGAVCYASERDDE